MSANASCSGASVGNDIFTKFQRKASFRTGKCARAVARKAVLAGLAGDDIDNWGIAIAKGAPLMLSALSQTETVSQSTMDAVSGVLFLISHLIEQEARIDPRWRNALQMAKMSTLPKEIIASLFECQTWANEVTAAVHRTMAGKTPIDALIEKESNDSNAHTTDPKNKKVERALVTKNVPPRARRCKRYRILISEIQRIRARAFDSVS